MVLKKEGAINEVVYNHTVYNKGENRYYPTIGGLRILIKEIIETNTTTDYIRFTPFYINYRLDGQIEFDEYMLYIECRDFFTKEELERHLSVCIGKNYSEFSDEELRFAHIRYPLCKHNDVSEFKRLLLSYEEYLNELIILLFNKVREEVNLSIDDMAFGHFCFEVHSG